MGVLVTTALGAVSSGAVAYGASFGLVGLGVIVVRAHRLWPRALLTPLTDAAPLSGADKRAYRQYARTQRFKGYERIDVDLSGAPRPPRERN